ncbi:hypothetical protein K440DRAFT_637825 [Wilcoxina mikolae CBS 423.85]|nr:hypothetical protein K440DRAFT_637825 [Wilcoxina mikolae CBS 423.85]
MHRLLPPLCRRLTTSANRADDALLNPSFLGLTSSIPPHHRDHNPSSSETIIPYTPSTTLSSLLPLIPPTAMTPSGLSSALYRSTARIRRQSGNWTTLSKWRDYDEKRALISKEVCEGEYDEAVAGEGEKGTVVAEAKRLMMRNGTAGMKAKKLVVEGVEEKLKGLKMPVVKAAEERKGIEA